jgi:polyprenyl P-hydroxybenzoate/phenylacrylic acid decarboxylase-like protein
MKLVVAITGASGPILAVRLLHHLRDHEVHLVVTRAAEMVIEQEVGDPALPCFRRYGESELDAPIASSSYLIDAMVIVPCTTKTMSAIAHGMTGNLVTRAADIALRMRRRLVLVPRETPLSLPTIESMRLACLAGASIVPPNMAYYHAPQSVDDVTGFFVGKILDQLGTPEELGIPDDLYRRWTGPVQ